MSSWFELLGERRRGVKATDWYAPALTTSESEYGGLDSIQ